MTCRHCGVECKDKYVIKVQMKLESGGKINLAEVPVCEDCAKKAIVGKAKWIIEEVTN